MVSSIAVKNNIECWSQSDLRVGVALVGENRHVSLSLLLFSSFQERYSFSCPLLRGQGFAAQ